MRRPPHGRTRVRAGAGVGAGKQGLLLFSRALVILAVAVAALGAGFVPAWAASHSLLLPLPDAPGSGPGEDGGAIAPWLSPPPEVVAFSLTPMYFLSFEKNRLSELSPPPSEEGNVALKLREGIERLASHLDWKATVLTLLLGEEEGTGLLRLLTEPSRGEEVILQLGGIASLATKLDFLAGFMEYLVYSLLDAEMPLPPLEEEITLVFNLEGSGLSAGVTAQVQGAGLLPLGGEGNPDSDASLEVREITVKIRSEAIRSEVELDPADLTLKRGQLEVQFQLGPNTITSTTVFAKGEGVQKEILVITAQLGDLSLMGQATWAGGASEFKLEATLAGLISLSTLLTPEGLLEPALGLQLRF